MLNGNYSVFSNWILILVCWYVLIQFFTHILCKNAQIDVEKIGEMYEPQKI